MKLEEPGRPSRWISIYRHRATGREVQALQITQVIERREVHSHVATDLYWIPFVGSAFFDKYDVKVGGWLVWNIYYHGKNGPKEYASPLEFAEQFELLKAQSLLELHPEEASK